MWEHFGNTEHYTEPFCGSAAVLLTRPDSPAKWETINDVNGHIANFWRSLQKSPEATAKAADWPINENDLHARHR